MMTDEEAKTLARFHADARREKMLAGVKAIRGLGPTEIRQLQRLACLPDEEGVKQIQALVAAYEEELLQAYRNSSLEGLYLGRACTLDGKPAVVGIDARGEPIVRQTAYILPESSGASRSFTWVEIGATFAKAGGRFISW